MLDFNGMLYVCEKREGGVALCLSTVKLFYSHKEVEEFGMKVYL